MSNQTVEPFESDEIDDYIKYNREYRFMNMNTKGFIIGKIIAKKHSMTAIKWYFRFKLFLIAVGCSAILIFFIGNIFKYTV